MDVSTDDLSQPTRRHRGANDMTREEMDAIFAEHARLEAFDFDGVLRTMTADCYQVMPSLGLRREGPAGVRAFYAELFGAFPDLRGEGSTQTAYAPNKTVRWGTFGGRMTGPFLGFHPTGRNFQILRFTVIAFRDNLLWGETTHFDADTFCSQLDLPLREVRAAAKARSTPATPVSGNSP
jgi:predicted ester cyclase